MLRKNDRYGFLQWVENHCRSLCAVLSVSLLDLEAAQRCEKKDLKRAVLQMHWVFQLICSGILWSSDAVSRERPCNTFRA